MSIFHKNQLTLLIDLAGNILELKKEYGRAVGGPDELEQEELLHELQQDELILIEQLETIVDKHRKATL